MSIAGFPTSSDIYLEVDGVKVAVVQSYSAKASKTSSAVEAFGAVRLQRPYQRCKELQKRQRRGKASYGLGGKKQNQCHFRPYSQTGHEKSRNGKLYQYRFLRTSKRDNMCRIA